jgi:hypothetical protein
MPYRRRRPKRTGADIARRLDVFEADQERARAQE